MASTLPNPSDCCTMCEGLSVTVADYGSKQIYSGNGDPNTAALVPDTPTIEALYYNMDVPGEMWWWNITDQVWI